MEEVLKTILTSIVENPDAIEIERKEVDTSVTFVVTADANDIGKIIGKNGKTITAIRNVLKVLAMKQGKWVSIELAE